MQDTKQTYTNKELLVKGLKRMALALPLLIITTWLFTFAFLNKDTLPLYLLVPLAVIAMGCTIYLIFNGLKLIMRSLFEKQ